MPFSYNNLISIENLFQAREEFKKGKRNKKDVQVFERNLEDNLFDLHRRLKNKTYQHGGYQEFWVNDPKRRHIHKASVEDRIVHHLLYKYLYSVCDKTFIHDSYSCRLSKGTHKALRRLRKFSGIISKNYTQDCWALKLDIKQFFASVDHQILKKLLQKRLADANTLWLLENVIDSFSLEMKLSKGIPLGNLTSQIFANIYLNKLDQFIKCTLKVKYYLRYADDFIILDKNSQKLSQYINMFAQFLSDELKLELHPKKMILRKLTWGIDFCGYVALPRYILPREKTYKRIYKKITSTAVNEQSLQSYLGYLSHASAHNKSKELINSFWLHQ